MFIRNCWYVAAWSHEVAAEGMFTRTICDQPIVFWRTADGAIHAFDDRCCHRGAPLSCGRREGDHVRCMYHGFLYDQRGICIEIPGQDRVPEKARVRRYAVEERHRWVWIWMGDPEAADPSLITDTHWLDDPAWGCTSPGYLHYDVDYQLINDNLLDYSHFSFVHPTTLRASEAYAQLRSTIAPIDRGLRITRWFMDQPVAPFAEGLLAAQGIRGPVDRWNEYDFILPGILVMDSGFAPAGQGAERGNRDGAIEFRQCGATTPENENAAHHFFGQARNFKCDNATVDEVLFRIILDALEEDRDIISAQARNLVGAPDFEPVPCALDLGPTMFRRLIVREIDLEAAEMQP